MTYRNGIKATGGRWYSQSKGLKDQIRRTFDYTCQLCGKPGWIVDHIIPWRISHDSTISNLRILCPSCNIATRRERRDAALPLDEWYSKIETELST